MGPQNARRIRRIWICAVAATTFAAMSWLSVRAQPAPPATAAAATPPIDNPSARLFELKTKFTGAGTCSNAKCHGAPEGAPAGADYVNPSYTLWNKAATADAPGDPHRSAFRTLVSNPKSKTMSANAAADAKCLNCHSLNAPQPLRGDQFQLAEGVTCNACHGPSGSPLATPANKGWIEAHTKKGWVAQQRTAFAGKHDEMLAKTGVHDTRPLAERSKQCVSCHLAIDAVLIAKGHPQPTFEMNWYSLTYANRHWTDPTDKYFGAQLWAAGQAASLEAATKQLATRATAGATDKDLTSAYTQALSHYSVIAPLFIAGGVKGSPADVATQLTAALKAIKTGGAGRADVAKAASAASASAAKLSPAVAAYVPTKATAMALVKALLAQPPAAEPFGIEQQRDAVFAIYNAYASSDDAKADKDAEANRDFIGQKLFPVDAAGALVKVDQLKPADHKAAMAEVKAKLKM